MCRGGTMVSLASTTSVRSVQSPSVDQDTNLDVGSRVFQMSIAARKQQSPSEGETPEVAVLVCGSGFQGNFHRSYPLSTTVCYIYR